MRSRGGYGFFRTQHQRGGTFVRMSTQPYYQYWGKADRAADRTIHRVHLLPYHCLDVAAVADALLREDLSLFERVAGPLGMEQEHVLPFVRLMVACHDLGKFSKTFQMLVPEAVGLVGGVARPAPCSERHDALGWLFWDDTLLDRIAKARVFGSTDVSESELSYYLSPIVQPVFGHHGKPVDIMNMRIDDHFDAADQEAAALFIMDLASLFATQGLPLPADLETFHEALTCQSWLLSGLFIISDWIGSNDDYFPYTREIAPLTDYWQRARAQAEEAIHATGMLPVPSRPFTGMGALFPDIRDREPSPLQRHVAACDIPAGPQLWIMEDITGSGKTEAAITLAHRLMDQGLSGMYIALPTMATANAMYERMAKAYHNLFAEDAEPSLVLAHSKRSLMEKFTASVVPVSRNATGRLSPSGNEQDGAAVCAQWIADNRKKALLAHVGVGTIDQALLAVLPAKHHTLRLLGLTNKVIIVDEVHACDRYMAILLEGLLEFHAAQGGSAILLSATIPQAMKDAFSAAFLRGLDGCSSPSGSGRFPAVTRVSSGGMRETAVSPRPDMRRAVAVTLIHDERTAVQKVIDAALAGAAVCWVRNTVADAVEAYQRLAELSVIDGDRLMLFHARFVLGHRLDREQHVLQRFGKNGDPDVRRGAVLVATQVVEQSLDLDFDFMISDLAPMDLLIQRAGRIHRHERAFRGGCSEPAMSVLSPCVTENPDQNWYAAMFPRATYVYQDTPKLWLTARLLEKYRGWTMPDHARDLVEGVYGRSREPVPEGLWGKECTVEGDRLASESHAYFNCLRRDMGYGGQQRVPFDEGIAPTRSGEPSITLRLAVHKDEKLLPIDTFDPPDWMLSEIQVRESVLGRSDNTSWDIVRAEPIMQDGCEWSQLLVLEDQTNGTWAGTAANGKGEPVTVVYCRETGLHVQKHGASCDAVQLTR